MSDSLTLDVARLTTRQFAEFVVANNVADVDRMAVGLAACVVTYPAEWETATPERIARLKFRDWKVLIRAFNANKDEATENQTPDMPEGVGVDLDEIEAREVVGFMRAVNMDAAEDIAGYLSRIVTAAPKAWGDPSKPDTWLKLSYFGIVLPLCRAILNDSQDYEKKTRSGSR